MFSGAGPDRRAQPPSNPQGPGSSGPGWAGGPTGG
jgi:hypothetical protein